MSSTPESVETDPSSQDEHSAPTRSPDQRGSGEEAARRPPVTTVLVATPSPGIVAQLTAGLLDLRIGRVLQAGSADEVDEFIAETVVGDLALVSVAFGATTQRLIRDLRRAGWPQVIALVPTADPAAITAALHAGASGILRRGPVPPAGDPIYAPASVQELSAREVQVIRLVADGRSNNEIGQRLDVSSETVKSHLNRIGRRLGTGDRAHIVAIALRAGIIS